MVLYFALTKRSLPLLHIEEQTCKHITFQGGEGRGGEHKLIAMCGYAGAAED